MVVAQIDFATSGVGAATTKGDDCGGQPVSVIPTLAATIARIAHEAVCGPDLARRTYEWIDELTDRARQSPSGVTTVTAAEMRKPTYMVYAIVAPHGRLATPASTDSAWDMITARLTRPEDDEIGLLHDNRDNRCAHQVVHGVNRPL